MFIVSGPGNPAAVYTWIFIWCFNENYDLRLLTERSKNWNRRSRITSVRCLKS